MVTIVAVSSEGAVPHGFQGNSQDLTPGYGVYRHHPHGHRHGPRGHRSSPIRVGRRHDHHHGHHFHLKGPFPHGTAQPHGHEGHCHRGHKFHGGSHHGLRGRHVSRGLHDFCSHEPGSPCRRRMHRSLSPHHLMHNRSSEGSLGSPRRGQRGQRGHGGRVPIDVSFHVFSFRGQHVHFHSEEPISDFEPEHASPLPVAIEQGIEQLGQLSLRSESGSQ